MRLEDWKRQEVFNFFRGRSNPFYMVTFNQDVTNLVHYSKQNSISFYYALMHCICMALDKVEAFHYCLKGEEIFYINQRKPSFTDMKKGSEQFHIVNIDMEEDIISFCEHAKTKSENHPFFIDYEGEEDVDEMVFISCLPWIELTALTNERDLSTKEQRESSTPSISWGKYKEENGKIIVGISIEVNHMFIDGVHIGLFAQHLTEIINKL